MKVNFEKCVLPCVINDVTIWHLHHGFIWDVVEAPSGRRIAVFFCTLLCGDGCFVHFETVKNLKISWATVFAAMRKGVQMISPYGNVIYATIPEEKKALIRVACKLGFSVVKEGSFDRDGENIVLLKFLDRKKIIVYNKNHNTKF